MACILLIQLVILNLCFMDESLTIDFSQFCPSNVSILIPVTVPSSKQCMATSINAIRIRLWRLETLHTTNLTEGVLGLVCIKCIDSQIFSTLSKKCVTK